jgi:hypothetical protein
MMMMMMMIEKDKYGALIGIRFGRGSRSTKIKPVLVPFCPHHVIRNQTRTTAVGIRRLTAWPMARPKFTLEEVIYPNNDYDTISILFPR